MTFVFGGPHFGGATFFYRPILSTVDSVWCVVVCLWCVAVCFSSAQQERFCDLTLCKRKPVGNVQLKQLYSFLSDFTSVVSQYKLHSCDSCTQVVPCVFTLEGNKKNKIKGKQLIPKTWSGIPTLNRWQHSSTDTSLKEHKFTCNTYNLSRPISHWKKKIKI